MLKDAPIVILDEATASIDPENEAVIQQAISRLTEGKTDVYKRQPSAHCWPGFMMWIRDASPWAAMTSGR